MNKYQLWRRYLLRKLWRKYVNEVYIPSGTKVHIKSDYKTAYLTCPSTGREVSFSFLGHNIFFD